MPLKHRLTTILVLSMHLLALGCGGTPAPPSPTPRAWRTAAPEGQGLDPAGLAAMMAIIDEQELPIDAVLVVRNGRIVLEEYPNPDYGPDTLHNLYSVTKSITSALIGIALQEGVLEGLDQKVLGFFPGRTIHNLDERKQSLTLEHLLTMTCGFEWEGPDDAHHTWGAAVDSGDPVQFVLDQPMAGDPGSDWTYNGGCSHLLSAILTEASGDSTLDFAREHLFGPLGITNVTWPQDPTGIYYGGQDIWLTPRDMAKLGVLFLNNGVWQGEQVVPAEWVDRSTDSYTTLSDNSGYGYQWWTFPRSGVYYASGWHGQTIYVVPGLDLVVVFTADFSDEEPDPEAWLLHQYILPSAKEYEPLAERYVRHGLSFEYPAWMDVQEGGPLWPSISEASGAVQAAAPFRAPAVGLIWEPAGEWSASAGLLDDFYARLEAWARERDYALAVIDRGSLETSTVNGHEMVYQQVTVEEGWLASSVVFGAWICDESDRAIIFYYTTPFDFGSEQERQAEFQRYLDSVTCHGADLD